MHDDQDIKTAVRERYAGHATASTSCCDPDTAAATLESSGCGCGATTVADSGRAISSEALGYRAEELDSIPEGADLGLGCGNPLAMLELAEGETVLDLGSGGGIDCFIAAKRVGPTGHVIGVDMTPEMIDRARRNAAAAGAKNVEFRLGEIEHLPVADGSVDAIISNCVVNLVPDKQQVFNDAFRVLRPGGRLSVSDIVLLGEVPVQIRDSVEAYVACLSGAVLKDEYLEMLRAAGFSDVRVEDEQRFTLGDVVSEDLVAEFERYAFVRSPKDSVQVLFQAVTGYRFPADLAEFDRVAAELEQQLGPPASTRGEFDRDGAPLGLHERLWTGGDFTVHLGARWTEEPDVRTDRMLVTWTDLRLARISKAYAVREPGKKPGR